MYHVTYFVCNAAVSEQNFCLMAVADSSEPKHFSYHSLQKSGKTPINIYLSLSL